MFIVQRWEDFTVSKLCIMDHVRASFMAHAKICIPVCQLIYLIEKLLSCQYAKDHFHLFYVFFILTPGLHECLQPQNEIRLRLVFLMFLLRGVGHTLYFSCTVSHMV